MQHNYSARNPYFISLCLDQNLEVARSKRFYKHPVDGLVGLSRLVSQHRFWAPIVWQDGHNKKDKFLAAYYMVLDLDDSPLSLEDVKRKLRDLNYGAIIYPTQSHQKPKGEKPAQDRFRFAIPFSRPILDLKTFQYNMRAWVRTYFADNGCSSGALPFRPALDGVEIIEGDRLADWVTPPTPRPKREVYRNTRVIPSWLDDKIKNGIPGKSRHVALFHIAAQLAACGFSEAEVINITQSSPVWEQGPDDDSRRTAKDGWRAGKEG